MISRGGSTQHERDMATRSGALGTSIVGGLSTDTEHRDAIDTRQIAVEEFTALVDNAAGNAVTVTGTTAEIIRASAKAGMRRGLGRGGARLSHADKLARKAAMKEAPALFAKHFAEAKATGAHQNPRSWAREQTAEELRQVMEDLGAKPPAVETIMKWKF